MTEYHTRRSCRVAMSVPVRVYGTDYRGVDFTEDALTLIVNLHGAKIRLTHQLLPDSEIRLLSQPTGRDSVFRVVSKLASSELRFTYWGVENLHPEKNIWGVDIPPLRPRDQVKVRVTLECQTVPRTNPCAEMKNCWRDFWKKVESSGPAGPVIPREFGSFSPSTSRRNATTGSPRAVYCSR